MPRIYNSIEAVMNQEANPCNCGCKTHSKRSKVVAVNQWSNYDTYEQEWICNACGVVLRTALYITRHAQNSMLNPEQRQKMKRARHDKNWSLKDLAVYMRLSVSDLGDFERGYGVLPLEVVREIERLLQVQLIERNSHA